MGLLRPIHWLILSLVLLLLLGGYGQIRAALAHARRKLDQRPFFHGMTPANSLALAGAMLLALSLLVDVYGADLAAGAQSDDVSLGLAGSGGVLVLLSFFLERRSRNRRG
ncbi:MAG: hypothetical protein WDN45_17690 [Caulobacteraceae bacterium]